jgi:hypothetical protein
MAPNNKPQAKSVPASKILRCPMENKTDVITIAGSGEVFLINNS